MDDLSLLIELHRTGERQGPGGDAQTHMAIALSGLTGATGLRIADIGCGTGASTLVLAKELDAQIIAVDFLSEFLSELESRADQAGLAERITPLQASMDALPFAAGEFDAIWAEGAIYNVGFESGAAAWHKFLKPGGILAVSEITWLTQERPAELQAHWDSEYSEIDTATAKLAILEQQGFAPIGYFVLPESCWLENYYGPMEQRFDSFLTAHNHTEAAQAIVAAERQEIALYRQYSAFYSYGYYIARKVTD